MFLARADTVDQLPQYSSYDYANEYQETSSKLQSSDICPLDVPLGYIQLHFNKTGLTTTRRFSPEPDDTQIWELYVKVEKSLNEAKKSNKIEEFCQQAANTITLLAATDSASTASLKLSNSLQGKELMINPEKRSNQLASSLESLELLQTDCKLPEALVLRSQFLLLQRFQMISNGKYEGSELPCISEKCIETDNFNEFINLLKTNTFILFSFTFMFGLIPIIKQKINKKQPPILEINSRPIEQEEKDAKRIIKPSITVTLLILQITMMSLPNTIYESLLC